MGLRIDILTDDLAVFGICDHILFFMVFLLRLSDRSGMKGLNEMVLGI